MSNKDLDKLVNAAFNEADEVSDATIQDWLKEDEEAQKLHQEMSSLNVGLKSLRDIPECQLTSDRLRDAILSQGVKPQPTKTAWWKWAAPALAAACAGAFLFSGMLNNPSGNGPVANNDSSNAAASIVPDTTEDAMDTVRELDNLVATNSGAARGAAASVLNRSLQINDLDEIDTATLEANIDRPTRTVTRRSRQSNVNEEAVINAADLVAANLTNTVSKATVSLASNTGTPNTAFGGGGGLAAPAMMDSAVESNDAPPVVILNGEILPSTRAQGAVEIQNDNIVFGG